MARNAVLSVQVLVDAAKASQGLDDVSNKVEGFGSKLAKNATKLVAGLGVLDFAKDSIQALVNIERISAQTEAAIKSTGGAANVTSGHVQEMADQLEGLTASESESIQEGENLLLTFTNLKNGVGEGNDIFDQATAIMVDMSRALGQDMSASATQLGKALNDPIAGVSALSKVGVTFTAQQKDLIKSLVESGDVMGAQKIILQELNKEFGGSGAAYAATAAGQWDTFTNSLGNFGETIVSGVMPALKGLVTAGTGFMNFFSGAGTGIQSMVLALGALILLRGPLSSMWTSATTAVRSFTESMAVQKALAAQSGVQLGTLGAAAATAGTRFQALKTALGGMLASAGPGLGLVAVITIIGAFVNKMQDAKNAADEGKAAIQPLVDALVKSGGAWDAAARAAKNTAIVNSDAFKGMIAAGASVSDTVAVLQGDYEKFFAMERDGSTFSGNLTTELEAQVFGFMDAAGGAEQLAAAQREANKILGDAPEAIDPATKAMEDEAAASAAAEEQAKKLGAALDALKTQYKDAFKKGGAQGMLDELDVVRQKAERAGEVMHAALEKAFPERGILRQNGLTDMFDQIRKLPDMIKQEDIGGKIKDIFKGLEGEDALTLSMLGDPGTAVRDWAGGFQSAWDQTLQDTFRDTGGQVDETVRRMMDTTGTEIQRVADALGISYDDAAQVVHASIGNINAETLKDKVVKLTAQDQELFEKTLFYDSITFDPVTKVFKSDIQIPEVQTIVDQMNAKYGLAKPAPIPQPVQIGAPTAAPGAFGRYMVGGDLAGQKLPTITAPTALTAPTSVPGGAVGAAATSGAAQTAPTVTAPVVTSGTAEAQAKINGLKAAAPVVVTVTANLTQATSQVNTFTSASRAVRPLDVTADVRDAYLMIGIVTGTRFKANINVSATVNDAYLMIGIVTGTRFSALITVSANTASALESIHAVERGSYTAVIRVIADTSSFNSTFNSLPSVRGVAAAPALAPQVAAAAFAAPALARGTATGFGAPVATRSAQGSAGITINVTGSLFPDETARAVENVLRARDRRMGAVRL